VHFLLAVLLVVAPDPIPVRYNAPHGRSPKFVVVAPDPIPVRYNLFCFNVVAPSVVAPDPIPVRYNFCRRIRRRLSVVAPDPIPVRYNPLVVSPRSVRNRDFFLYINTVKFCIFYWLKKQHLMAFYGLFAHCSWSN
jgi:hypothetical protein